MPIVTILVQGSAPDPYRVTFDSSPGKLLAFCTCEAGAKGQQCKHRVGILLGGAEGVIDHDPEILAAVRLALVGTPLAVALTGLAEAEARVEAAKQLVAASKRQVAAAMRA